MKAHPIERKCVLWMIIAASVAVVLLGSCTAGLLPTVENDEGSGSVLVSIGSLSALTIEPTSLSLRTAGYTITLGDGLTVSPATASAGSGDVVFASVPEGEWTVTVEAFNGVDPNTSDRIGAGTDTVTVTAGQTVKATVVVEAIAGDGSASLSISWPTDVVFSPAIVASLTDEAGAAIDISSTAAGGFAVDMGAGTATYSGTHPSGKYLLSIQLVDDSAVIWGFSDDIWLVSDGGETPTPIVTSQSWTLSKADIRHKPERATNLQTVRRDLTEVTVRWDDNSQVETGYVLRATIDTNGNGLADDGSSWTQVELRANATEGTISTQANTAYIFEVQATNAAGVSTSTQLSATTPIEETITNLVIDDPNPVTWNNNSVYTVSGYVYVSSGNTLEIGPGTIVRFEADAYIKVLGTLKVLGTEGQPVLFTSAASTPGYEDWESIYFTPGSDDAVLDASDVYQGTGSTIQNAVIEYGNGIYIEDSFPFLVNVSVRSARGYHDDTGLGQADYSQTGYGVVFVHVNAATSGAGRMVFNGVTVNGALGSDPASRGLYFNLEDTGGSADVVDIVVRNSAVSQAYSGIVAQVGDPDSSLIFDGTDAIGNSFGYTLESYGGTATVSGSRITANETGAVLSSSSGALEISGGSIVENNSSVGVQMAGVGGSVTVTGSTIQNNTKVGVQTTTTGAATTISQNVITGNGQNGIRNEGGTLAQPVLIQYNSIEQNGNSSAGELSSSEQELFEGGGLALVSGWPSVQNNDILNQVGLSAVLLGNGLTDFTLTANNISNPSADYDLRVGMSRQTQYSTTGDAPAEIDVSGNYWSPALPETVGTGGNLGVRVYDYWENMITLARATATSQLGAPATTGP